VSEPGGRICVVVRESNPEQFEHAIVQSRQIAGILELRLDYLSPTDLTPSAVANRVCMANCPVILTLRRKSNGGEFAGSEAAQVRLLRSLLKVGAAYIDLEIETVEGFLGGHLDSLRSGSARWIASYHNFEHTPADLSAIYERLLRTKPDIVKLATQACRFEDNFRMLELAQRAQREGQPIVALAMGELGAFSRFAALSTGSLWTYGSLGQGKESAPGQLNAEELNNVYSVGQLREDTAIYGVIGYPVGHSLSPHIHNAAFHQLSLNACYLPFAVRDLADFSTHLRKFAGFSVTIPHKVKILDYVDNVDETVRLTGAANTLVNRQGRLFAYNTDVPAIEQALQKPLREGIHRATLLGTGGAARAAALVLKGTGCQVTVLARDPRKAGAFAGEFGFQYDALERGANCHGDLLINATSVGMCPNVAQSPLPPEALDYRYVFDMVYNPPETRLLREAQPRSFTISGVEMFIAQAARQFELWTGDAAPVPLMREIVLQRLAMKQN